MTIKEAKGKKVLILGAVEGEIPLVNAFHKLGCYVIVVGKGTNYPCCSIADKVYDVDMMDKNLVLKIAKEENVSAITSNVVERAIRIAAWVAENAGLEGITSEVAEIFTNKYKMREAAKRIGVGVPEFQEVESVNEAIKFAHVVGYPLIMKPVDNGGSQGVQRVNCDEDIINGFKYSIGKSVQDAKVIIEQYISGDEYIVDGFTHNYICDNTDVTTKEKFQLDKNFVSKAVVLQDAKTAKSHIEQQLLNTNKKLVEGIGLKFGITHGEYIYNKKEDKVYLVEITARGGGVYLSSDLTPLASGIDVNELLAQYSLGIDPLGKKHLEISPGASAWYAFSLPKGEIIKVSGVEEAKKIVGVHDIINNGYNVGAQTRDLIDDSGKYGPILIFGKTRQECYQVFDQVKTVFHIEVQTKDGIKEIIW